MEGPARADFAACLAWASGVPPEEVPVPAGTDPFVGWRGWLAAQGLGLVPIADAARFSWPGYWIARGKATSAGTSCAVVMFGVPSGPVFWPGGGGDPPELTISDGFAVAALDLRATPSPPEASPDPGTGSVEAIFVAPEAGAPMRAVTSARATRAGLVGDRYERSARAGASRRPAGRRRDAGRHRGRGERPSVT